MKENTLEDRLVDFSADIVRFARFLNKKDHVKPIVDQIIRSSYSVALNYGEAQSAESRKDFIHKMRISLKELRETKVAMKIIGKTIDKLDNDQLQTLMKEVKELISIFIASINTATTNLQNQK
ncbi:four helix bundle protein [Bacteroidota bacterium]